VTGLPGHLIEDVVFEDIDISFSGGGLPEDIGRELPEQQEMYPEHFYFGALPASGFYVRHARKISFSRVNTELQHEDARPVLGYADIEAMTFEECYENNKHSWNIN